MSERAAADTETMTPRRTKIAIALTCGLVAAMALGPAAASAWTAQAKTPGYASPPRFTFKLHANGEHTSISDLQVHSPCVVSSGYRVVNMHHISQLHVGSQSGLHGERTSSLSFHGEGDGLRFELSTNLTPGWGGELVGPATHVTLTNPGVCHEAADVHLAVLIETVRR